ncbi:MAG: hypothetical protein AAFX99_35900, partial [Myxococcota bacterium]
LIDPNAILEEHSTLFSSTETPAAPAPFEPAPPSHQDTMEWILQATHKLGLKRKTARRLLSLAELPELPENHHSDAFVKAVENHLADSLFSLLERNDFNRTHSAKELGVWRSTLLNLMKRFDHPRAMALSNAQLDEAKQHTEGDHEQMARLLKVTPAGLSERLGQDSA